MIRNYHWSSEKRRSIEVAYGICLKSQYEKDRIQIEQRDTEYQDNDNDIADSTLKKMAEYISTSREGKRLKHICHQFGITLHQAKEILKTMQAKRIIYKNRNNQHYKVTNGAKANSKVQGGGKPLNCKNCGVQFTSYKNRHTCSEKCKDEVERASMRRRRAKHLERLKAENEANPKPVPMAPCVICGGEFPKGRGRKTCGVECRQILRKQRDANYKAKTRGRRK